VNVPTSAVTDTSSRTPVYAVFHHPSSFMLRYVCYAAHKD